MTVLKVKSLKENETFLVLKKSGYNPVFPRTVKRLITAGKERYVIKPVFPGYMFLDMGYISSRDYYIIITKPFIAGFLEHGKHLTALEEEYIRILNNDGKPIEQIKLDFDKNGMASVNTKILNKCLNSKNIVRLNKSNKTVTFSVNMLGRRRKITLNYCL